MRRSLGVPLLLLGLCLSDGCQRPGPRKDTPALSSTSGSGLSILLITIDTLRPDHLGAYGYGRPTSPRMDAIAKAGTLFEQAYTFWPKTRGSFVAMLTGRPPSRSGYSKTHPVLLDLNPTLASVLQAAGYTTVAVVDNPNVASSLGYAKGFATYRETWEDKALPTEMDRTRAITEAAESFLASARAAERPFLLWLHYVNPHTPYTPPAPFDRMFLEGAQTEPRLRVVPGLHGGIPRQWAVSGQDRLGYYVSQYDGEIAAVDQEVGRVWDALQASSVRQTTLVVVTSDHGESLGEHDYFFDHGEDLFDPSLRIPLLVVQPGAPPGQRAAALTSTLDLVPTLLDAAKVSWPADLAGVSVLPAIQGRPGPARERLFAQNDRNLSAAFGRDLKVVAIPDGDLSRYALYDRKADPGETRDVGRSRPETLRDERRELELYLQRSDHEWVRMRPLVEGRPGEGRMSPEACERLRALGYVQPACE